MGLGGSVASAVQTVASVAKDVAPLVQAGATAYAAHQARKASQVAGQIAPPSPIEAMPDGVKDGTVQDAKNSVSGVGQANGQSGNAQTFLTGAGGVDSSGLTIGKPTIGGESTGVSNSLLADEKKKYKSAASTLFGG